MLLDYEIAQVCHEANRALQAIQADPGIPVAPLWEDETAETRLTVTAGVRHAIDGASPERLHETWCMAKRRDGWRYGDVKDEMALTHPCLVEYDQLPAAQRVKDALFAAIVGALTEEA